MMPAANSATAFGFGDRPAPRQLRLISWKHVPRGQLRGWATIEITSIGLRIVDVPVLIGRDGPWATLPEKPALDRDGKRKLDINGKPEWATVLEWKSRELRQGFSDAVVAAVRRAHPGDLD
jgi:hypothetical protein